MLVETKFSRTNMLVEVDVRLGIFSVIIKIGSKRFGYHKIWVKNVAAEKVYPHTIYI